MEDSFKRCGFDGDFVLWKGVYPDGAPDHLQSPWGFKPFCFLDVMRRGYDAAIWVDSSAVAIRSISLLIDALEKDGYCIFKNHDFIWGEWCSDEALHEFGVTREESFGIPEVYGGCIGMKFSHPLAQRFLEKWQHWARDGAVFRGTERAIDSAEMFADIKHNRQGIVSGDPRVRGHRHDQTAAGILAHQLGMKITNGGVTDRYSGVSYDGRVSIIFERSDQVSLSRVLRMVYFEDRIKHPLRLIKRRLSFLG